VNRSQWVDILRLLGLGWYVVTAIGLGVAMGLLLDHWIDTSPIFVLAGLALGLIAAFWGMYRMLTPLLKGDFKSKDDS